MSWFGKKFRRTGGSNLDDFFKSSNAPEVYKKMLCSNVPTWCYRLLDPQTLQLEVVADNFNFTKTCPLGVEQEIISLEGAKSYMTLTLEGENVMKQRIRKPNGSIANFKREFFERSAVMTITMEGADVRKAHVFYEVVD
ncbi:uncharacterized protein LOC125233533 [Leguminivora glycinivorella]|uniref:uncharacterized protein LOC125233533 n=1 Tax=Leguminivora glycinivorella TaxID=1035111 RepID=UPI00200C199B|nr:uncharacterized protein LOC125233533 [Leguminivora glycinivorella]